MEDVKLSWRQKIFKEFSEYLVNFIYMSLIFSAIILYRRVALSQYGIEVNDYFLGVIKAFIIAKVVMIGAFWKTSRKFENKPLLIPILYKAVLFTIMVMLFDIVEVYIHGLIVEGTFSQAYISLVERLSATWFSSSLLIFLIFIPFFATKELIRLMGKEKVKEIFLKTYRVEDNNTNI